GAAFLAPASFSIQGTNSSGTTNVQVFTNNVSVSNFTSSPFSFPLSNVLAGSYTLSAIATDSSNLKATNTVSVTVVSAPTVSITNPLANAVFEAPATLALQAAASAGVTNVQFLTNNVSVGNVASAPFNLTLNNVGTGSYT